MLVTGELTATFRVWPNAGKAHTVNAAHSVIRAPSLMSASINRRRSYTGLPDAGKLMPAPGTHRQPL
jgi:hypothetical protein